MPHARRYSYGDTFTCPGCGATYELVFTGLWGIPLRLRRLAQSLGRKLKGARA